MFRKSGIFSNHHHVGGFFTYSSLLLILCAALLCFTTPAVAEITWTGDVIPTDPTTWTSSTTAYIGKTSNGVLNITNGSDVSSGRGYIGFDSGATGEVTVDGTGSTWTNSSGLDVGSYDGNGTLSITNGGTVSSHDWSYIGHGSNSTGEVVVDGIGSMWTSDSLHVGDFGSGVLNITGGGVVSSSDGNIDPLTPSSTGEVTVDGPVQCGRIAPI